MADENAATIEFIRNLPAIIGAFALFLASVVGTALTIFTFRRAGRAEQLARNSVEVSTANQAEIKTIGVNVDGKLTDLLAAREDAADAKGQLKERDAERAHLSDTTHTEDDPLAVKLVKGKQ